MDRQCSSCGGFCKKSGCERENVKPEQEPVAWMNEWNGDVQINKLPAECYGEHWTRTPLYTAPPRREWVGLTDDDINDLWITAMWNTEGTRLPIPEFACAIEAKLKQKNI